MSMWPSALGLSHRVTTTGLFSIRDLYTAEGLADYRVGCWQLLRSPNLDDPRPSRCAVAGWASADYDLANVIETRLFWQR
jgi:hypothetical protein